MEALLASRYNIYWYLSFMAPAAIMIFFSFFKIRKVLILGVIISIIVTYSLCNLAVQKKWKTRFEIAKTENEISYATRDGANLVFTAVFIGPTEAVLYTAIWGFVGVKVWKRRRKKK